MDELIEKILFKYSYTNEDGENVIEIKLFQDIINDICEEIDKN